MHDVLIIGGGVIGLSLAYELAGQGVTCALVDQGQLGREASWAGAGILPPGNPQFSRTPEQRLRAASHVLWPALSERLRTETGIDNGFLRCGGIEVHTGPSQGQLEDELCAWRDEGVTAEWASGDDVFRAEPALSRDVSAAICLPGMAQVRNPRHLRALVAGCARRGVRLLPGTPVCAFERAGERIVAVLTPAGRIVAGRFVVAAGAWSSGLLSQAGCVAQVRPLRGQIVLLAMHPCPFQQVIHCGPRYLVPRGDGRVLVGSTEDSVGFDRQATAGGVGGLIEFAVSLVPELARAAVERAWAGLRPQSADGLPYLGRARGSENLFVATGHFRSGLNLSPITAVLMAQAVLGRPTDLPLEPYDVNRIAASLDPAGAPARNRSGVVE